MGDLGLHLAGADAFPAYEKSRAWLRENDAFRRDILELLTSSGPTTSRGIPDTCVVPWASSGRTNNRNVTPMLEFLMMRGEIAIAGRVGRERLWDLAERVYPAALGQDFEGRTALLSPFDRLVYDRARTQELFDFEYTLEMYKPAGKRRWGYFALPVLHGDRLVGKLDAVADRRAGMLRVHAIHEDVRFARATTKAVHGELEALAGWLGLVVERRQ